MSIKLIAIDIDGTLLNNDRKITPGVYQALKSCGGTGCSESSYVLAAP